MPISSSGKSLAFSSSEEVSQSWAACSTGETQPRFSFLNQIQLLISFFLCFSPLFIAICLHVKITKKFSSNICFDIKEISERGENFWEKRLERGLQGEGKCAEYSLGA